MRLENKAVTQHERVNHIMNSSESTTPAESSMPVEQKADQLCRMIQSYGRVAVALSGGVDSAVVSKAAYAACGRDAIAVTAVSPSLASGELEAAKALAEGIGLRHKIIHTDEFRVDGYQRNAGDRCYFCKTELYDQIEILLPQLQVDVICNGANLDDQGDHRPGMKAATEHSVRSPLIDARLTKQDVRELAKFWNLDVWDKPAMPCLSSRVAYGVEVTAERVRRIDRAERFLKETFGLQELRVRLEANDLARIEVREESISELSQPKNRQHLVNFFHEIGFQYVTIDLQGFRSGSMNAALEVVELQIQSPQQNCETPSQTG